MTTEEIKLIKVEVLTDLLESVQGWGTNERPLNIGTFKEIIKEAIKKDRRLDTNL